ncbi:MAG: hypothetical protein M1832_004247 [Thelocarpon impressellum]|nr:MAG: hypothetical protein M1832_004247 [Thelocarpon impressellum]
MLYELIAVVRPGNLVEVKEIARSTGSLILASNGVIRGLTNWGPFLLPRRVRVHQATHSTGHYFVMRFDAGAQAQDMVRRTLALDPRMIRFSVVKMGRTLEEVGKVAGRAKWREGDAEAGFGGLGLR